MRKAVYTAIEMVEELLNEGKNAEARELMFRITGDDSFTGEELDFIIKESAKRNKKNQ